MWQSGGGISVSWILTGFCPWGNYFNQSRNNVQRFYNAFQYSTEAVVRRCSIEYLFLKLSQNSQGNPSVRASFLIKLQVSGLQLY